MALFTHHANPQGQWRDASGGRFEIINAAKDKETFGGGLATLKMDGRAMLRTKPWGNYDSEFEYASAMNLTQVSPSGSAPGTASAISYDNGSSLIVANTVQAAIDEVEGRVDALESGGATPVFTPATATSNGSDGSIPGPAAGEEGYVLKGDGTWEDPLNLAPATVVTDNGDGTVTFDDGHGNTVTTSPQQAAQVVIPDTVSLVGTLGSLSDGDTILDALQVLDSLVTGSDAVFDGATAVAAGSVGDVPAPAAGDENKFLRGDGTWQAVSTGGPTPTVTDNGDGTYTFDNGVDPAVNLTTQPANFTFTTLDWSLVGANRVLMVPATTHGLSEIGLVQIRDSAGDYWGFSVNVSPVTKDVELTVPDGSEFDGTISISGASSTTAL